MCMASVAFRKGWMQNADFLIHGFLNPQGSKNWSSIDTKASPVLRRCIEQRENGKFWFQILFLLLCDLSSRDLHLKWYAWTVYWNVTYKPSKSHQDKVKPSGKVRASRERDPAWCELSKMFYFITLGMLNSDFRLVPFEAWSRIMFAHRMNVRRVKGPFIVPSLPLKTLIAAKS